MKARRWAPIVFGVTVFAAFVAISAIVVSIVWVREHLRIETSSTSGAHAAFQEVRQRYGAKPPLLEMQDTLVPRRNAPPPDAARTALTTLHVLAWDASDERLARFDIPFWLLRLKETPIGFGTYASGLDDLQISLTAAEIERYGPGVIVDVSRKGRDRALLWVE